MYARISKSAIKIAHAASASDSREALEHVNIGEGVIEACDGTILLQAPIDTDGQEHILVHAKTLLKAKSMKKYDLILTDGQMVGDTITLLPDTSHLTYPNTKQLYPTGDVVYKITLGRSVLKKLLACTEEEPIEFEFRDPKTIIEVKCGEVSGLLMPMRTQE